MQKDWNHKNISRGDRQMKKNRIKFLIIELFADAGGLLCMEDF